MMLTRCFCHKCWAQVAKPDVVVASYEALAGDAGALGALPWELICCDERTRVASGLGRAYQALTDFDARARAVVSSPALLQQARAPLACCSARHSLSPRCPLRAPHHLGSVGHCPAALD